jgi:phosphoglycolate phosphatase
MKFLAAIFDLDGTLLDTLADIADAMNAALERMGFPGHETTAYRYLTGDGVRALAERSVPELAKDETTVAACIQEFRLEYAYRWGAKTRPYPGIPELLAELAGRQIKLSVLSNKLDEFARQAVRDFLPGFDFSFIIGAKPDLPPKPDPAGALVIASGLRIPPSQIIYLGDTGVDIQTAVRAGMFPVGALWGFRDEKELRDNGARAVIGSPQELLGLICPE